MGVGDVVTGYELRHVLWEFGFLPTPVFVGNPKQTIAYTMDQIADFVRANYGKRPCYISHNPVFDFAKGRYPKKIYYSKNFIDFDADPKKGFVKENALKDLRVLVEWLDEYSIPFNTTSTSGKGYHLFIRFKPKVYRIDRMLADKIKAVQLFLANELGLKTMDFHVAEPRRITRIPLAAYVDNKGNCNGRHCIPLDREMIQKMEVRDIDELARMPYIPDELTMNPEGNYYTIDKFIEKFDIPLKFIGMGIDNGNGEEIKDYKVITNEPFLKIMKDIIVRPCVYRELVVEDRPAHLARLDACISIRGLGFSLSEALAMFDQFARAANWHDQHNTEIRHTNVKSIYLREPPYNRLTCGTLKREGLCVGDVCPHYRGG